MSIKTTCERCLLLVGLMILQCGAVHAGTDSVLIAVSVLPTIVVTNDPAEATSILPLTAYQTSIQSNDPQSFDVYAENNIVEILAR